MPADRQTNRISLSGCETSIICLKWASCSTQRTFWSFWIACHFHSLLFGLGLTADRNHVKTSEDVCNMTRDTSSTKMKWRIPRWTRHSNLDRPPKATATWHAALRPLSLWFPTPLPITDDGICKLPSSLCQSMRQAWQRNLEREREREIEGGRENQRAIFHYC